MAMLEKWRGTDVINLDDWQSYFLLEDLYHTYGNRAYKERPLFTTKTTPDWVENKDALWTNMNIPLFTRFANTTIDSLEMTYLFI